jgi:hypothetical protein
MTPIPRGLLIAGGLGLAAGAGFLLFKGKGDKKAEGEADPALKDPAAAGAGGMTPTAGTDPNAMAPTGTTTAPGAATGGMAGGQQVGPYTVIPDPQSGQMVVFETATQQPVGILDAQGNLVPLEGSGGALGPSAGTGVGTGAGTIVPEGAGLTPTGTTSSVPQAASGQAQFAAIAKDLFANAGNSGVGSASSDAMTGQASLAPATGLDAGAAQSTTTGGVRSEQVGNYTLLDDGSGTKVVLDTASQQPVAMMDAAGTITPISVDAAGNISVSGAPVGSASTGAASLTPGAGATGPVGMTDASAGASPYAPAATVTSPTAITAPVGAGVPGM